MGNDNTKVLRALEYIQKNLGEHIGLDDLARETYLSKYHFHRQFHKTVGESVSRYVSRKRLESAARELELTDGPILRIALKYQYGSQESFSRAFKRLHGVTPGQYRKRFTSRKLDVQARLGARPFQVKSLAA